MAENGRRSAVRRCLATGESGPTFGLVRFVLAPDGRVAPDLAERLPGRGAWVQARREAVERAAAKGLFSRAFGMRAPVDAGLADTIERLLARRVTELLAMARRAGEAAAGMEKCRALLGRGDALLLHARDGSMDGLRKLAGGGAGRAIRVLDGAELGPPFGRGEAVHVAVAPGGLARRIARECSRLAGFRPSAGGKDGSHGDH